MSATRRIFALLLATCLLLAGPVACGGDDEPAGGSPADKTCEHKGKIYQDQEEFADDCNSCKCNPEGSVGVGCTQIACPAASKTCEHKGKVYQDQEEFMDDCNSCKCNPEGSVGVACTEMACPPAS